MIGGIVDRNRLKNLTFDAANEMGIETAALPIGQFLSLSGLNVLTINQVLGILVHFLTNGGSWEKAFFSTIPLRKVDHGNRSNQDQDQDEDQEEDQDQDQDEDEDQDQEEGEEEVKE